LEPPALLTRLGEKGCRRVYVDGERTIQRFLRADLIMTILPLLIGEGIPLLGTLSDDSKWKHVSTKAFRSGVTQSTYPRDRSWPCSFSFVTRHSPLCSNQTRSTLNPAAPND
ncbi:MAG: hypothetical protein E4H08_09500, partial [Candidatus Atribacteria bacterium]